MKHRIASDFGVALLRLFFFIFSGSFFSCVFVSRMVGDNSFKGAAGHIECAHNRRWISCFFLQPFLIVYVWSDEFIWLLLLLFPKGVSYSVVQIHRICKVFYVSNIEHASAACVYSTDWLSNRTPSTVWAFPCALWGEGKSSLTPRWFHSIGWFPPRFHHTGLSIGFPRMMRRLCRCAKSKKESNEEKQRLSNKPCVPFPRDVFIWLLRVVTSIEYTWLETHPILITC